MTVLSDPNTEETVNCPICDTMMDVQRNVYGPTTWAGAMAGIKRHHDRFTCQHVNSDWHKQLVDLRDLIKITKASRELTNLLNQEFNQVKKTRKCTNLE